MERLPDLLKRLRWKNILVTFLGMVILVGIGAGVVAATRKHTTQSSPTVSKQTNVGQANNRQWEKKDPTEKGIDQTPKQTAIDSNGNVLDHSKGYMTTYTNSPEGIAVASSFDILTTAGHTVLNSPVKSGIDISASTDVQSHWVGGGAYTNLGGINASMLNVIKELDSISVKVERIGLLWPNYISQRTTPKGSLYTLNVTSALFKVTEKDGTIHYFVVKLQNEVDPPQNSTTKIHPVAMQAAQLSEVEAQSVDTALKVYFVQPN